MAEEILTGMLGRTSMMGRALDHVPHMKALGISFRGIDDGWVELEMAYSPDLVAYPDSGVIANGAIFALMDSTAGIAVVTGLRQSMPIATIDMRLDYLHPPAPFERLIGRAQCYKYTRSMAFVRGLAYQDSIDHPVANMVGSFVLPGAA
jgi:uncharacterized protein (TIGR00369 family)